MNQNENRPRPTRLFQTPCGLSPGSVSIGRFVRRLAAIAPALWSIPPPLPDCPHCHPDPRRCCSHSLLPRVVGTVVPADVLDPSESDCRLRQDCWGACSGIGTPSQTGPGPRGDHHALAIHPAVCPAVPILPSKGTIHPQNSPSEVPPRVWIWVTRSWTRPVSPAGCAQCHSFRLNPVRHFLTGTFPVRSRCPARGTIRSLPATCFPLPAADRFSIHQSVWAENLALWKSLSQEAASGQNRQGWISSPPWSQLPAARRSSWSYRDSGTTRPIAATPHRRRTADRRIPLSRNLPRVRSAPASIGIWVLVRAAEVADRREVPRTLAAVLSRRDLNPPCWTMAFPLRPPSAALRRTCCHHRATRNSGSALFPARACRSGWRRRRLWDPVLFRPRWNSAPVFHPERCRRSPQVALWPTARGWGRLPSRVSMQCPSRPRASAGNRLDDGPLAIARCRKASPRHHESALRKPRHRLGTASVPGSNPACRRIPLGSPVRAWTRSTWAVRLSRWNRPRHRPRSCPGTTQPPIPRVPSSRHAPSVWRTPSHRRLASSFRTRKLHDSLRARRRKDSLPHRRMPRNLVCLQLVSGKTSLAGVLRGSAAARADSETRPVRRRHSRRSDLPGSSAVCRRRHRAPTRAQPDLPTGAWIRSTRFAAVPPPADRPPHRDSDSTEWRPDRRPTVVAHRPGLVGSADRCRTVPGSAG